MQEIAPQQVTIQDPFWSSRLSKNAQHAIYHQWEQLEASRCIDNFRLVIGEKSGFRQGWFFSDSDAYKWLEAASRVYVLYRDPKLRAIIVKFISLLMRAQTPDGYLFTYNQLHFPGTRWVALQVEHELYCHGHLIEAGVSHFQATGEKTLLEVARKAADLLVRDFKGKGPKSTPGHEEIEIALLRLYQLTEQAEYLNLAQQFIEQRGQIPFFAFHLLKEFNVHNQRNRQVEELRQAYYSTHPEEHPFLIPPGNAAKKPRWSTQRWYINALRGFYAQQHSPIRFQEVPVGHSVRFGYLETAAAMLHRIQPDEKLLLTLEKAWEHMVTRRMYVTGGLGSLPGLEGFGKDYELDPELAYAETCAALASMFWNWEMALITGQAQYSDLFEWQLYNASAVGMGVEGDRYLYNNPLICRGGITRKPWYAVPCCPSNLSRTWASLSKYIFSYEKDAIWIHQYIGSEATLELTPDDGNRIRASIKSELPWQGRVKIQIEPQTPVEFTLHLRIPSWAGPESWVSVNKQRMDMSARPENLQPTASGYDPRQACFLSIGRLWEPGDLVEIFLDMPILYHTAHPRVKGHLGKFTISRGPVVYCLESIDHPELDIFEEKIDITTLCAEYSQGHFGEWILRGSTVNGKPVTVIPYALWGNRGESQMTVWVNTGDEQT